MLRTWEMFKALSVETVLHTQEMSKSCSLWRDCAEDGGDYLRCAFCGLAEEVGIVQGMFSLRNSAEGVENFQGSFCGGTVLWP